MNIHAVLLLTQKPGDATALVDTTLRDSPLLLKPFSGNSFICFLAPYHFKSITQVFDLIFVVNPLKFYVDLGPIAPTFRFTRIPNARVNLYLKSMIRAIDPKLAGTENRQTLNDVNMTLL